VNAFLGSFSSYESHITLGGVKIQEIKKMVLDGECLSYHRKLGITSQKICNEDMQFESVKK
jgi:hypothetical protein